MKLFERVEDNHLKMSKLKSKYIFFFKDLCQIFQSGTFVPKYESANIPVKAPETEFRLWTVEHVEQLSLSMLFKNC